MLRFIFYIFIGWCTPGLVAAQLPSNGITYDNLLKCDKPLRGAVEKITQTKFYQNGGRERMRYYFGENNQLRRVSTANGLEVKYFYDERDNLTTQLVIQNGEVLDSLVGIYTEKNRLRGLMTYRGKHRNLVSVQQVIYNRKNRPERIRIDEIRFNAEANTARHYAAWQELKWKNESEFSVDQVKVQQKTKYITKNANRAVMDLENGCLLQQNDYVRTINNLQGLTTVEIYQVEEDPTADKVMVEYEYDRVGNWVAQKHFSIADGERSRKKQRLMDVRRKIDYR